MHFKHFEIYLNLMFQNKDQIIDDPKNVSAQKR